MAQTYNDSEYKKMADIIHNCLQYGIGDNYQTLKNTLFLMKNNDDVKKLLQAYGFRYNFLYAMPLGEKENLLTNLQHQLSSQDLGIYTDYLNQIRNDWAKKKITFKI